MSSFYNEIMFRILVWLVGFLVNRLTEMLSFLLSFQTELRMIGDRESSKQGDNIEEGV